MSDSESQSAEIHQHSGWLIPLGIMLVILALCGMFLLYYLRPTSLRDSGPTAASTSISFKVRGVPFRAPANYLESRAAAGADLDVVALAALLPNNAEEGMRGYSAADAALFSGNAADSPVLHMLIRGDTNSLDPASRLARIYMPYILNPKGDAGPFGLTRYVFRADSGYGRDDLFTGGGNPMLLLLCERPAQDLPSPNCLAIDRPIARNINLSYRFKRAQLAHWQEINDGVGKLVAEFLTH